MVFVIFDKLYIFCRIRMNILTRFIIKIDSIKYYVSQLVVVSVATIKKLIVWKNDICSFLVYLIVKYITF